MLNPTYEHLRTALLRLKYQWFDDGDYNLNLVGIRSPIREAGNFDDTICVAFRQADRPTVLSFRATTDPGQRYLIEPINAKGAAILCPGQYPKMWQIGKHRNSYEALVQRGPCTVFRDNNRDNLLDPGPDIETGFFGINLHRCQPYSAAIAVGDYSAGCQVIASYYDFEILMAIARRAVQHYGDGFTYTLLNQVQL